MPFQFQLELPNGEPADPPTFASSTPTWRVGDRLFMGPGKTFRVLEVREEAYEASVLIVERE